MPPLKTGACFTVQVERQASPDRKPEETSNGLLSHEFLLRRTSDQFIHSSEREAPLPSASRQFSISRLTA